MVYFGNYNYQFMIETVEFHHCHASIDGGCVYFGDTNAYIVMNKVLFNDTHCCTSCATGDFGGCAIYLGRYSNAVTISNSSFRDIHLYGFSGKYVGSFCCCSYLTIDFVQFIL